MVDSELAERKWVLIQPADVYLSGFLGRHLAVFRKGLG
jgi:hypothetical protein